MTFTLENLTDDPIATRVAGFSLGSPRRLSASWVSVRDRLALKGLRAVGVNSGRTKGGAMHFAQGPVRRFSSARPHGSIFAVGRRVYVAGSGALDGRVALTDDAGENAVATVADGTEVEILAWRPRGSAGTRYRVRSVRNGLEGWIAVANLRGARSAVSPAPAVPPRLATGSSVRPRTEPGDSRRRVSQRSR